MNLILVDPHELNGRCLCLADHRARHIRKVLRCRPGDRVRLGVLNGPMGHATIDAMSGEEVCLRVSLDKEPPPKAAIDLILALPRPIMLRRVLAQAASLGVERIFLINAQRVEKSFFNASIIKENQLEGFLRQGLEQAVDTRLPALSLHRRFKPFVEDRLPELAAGHALRLVAHPAARERLSRLEKPLPGSRGLLAIGPEGGWNDYEVARFTEQGFSACSLGPRILRVDTAVPALVAQLKLLLQSAA